ncbi:MAG TPA: tetratricopeptide repeat protein, partial [Ktedonobacterales bacterium]|nr:tetratricopeptide repeat protein [Ktedonobacterales bacterium]
MKGTLASWRVRGRLASVSVQIAHLEQQNEMRAALELAVEAYELARQRLPQGHPLQVRCLLEVAELHFKRGEYAQAEQLCQLVVELAEPASGGRARLAELAEALNNLAVLEHAIGKYPEAEALLRRAQDLLCQLPRHRPDYEAETCENLGMVYETQGRYPEAEQVYAQALTVRRA